MLATSSSCSCHSEKVPSTPSPSPLNTDRGGTCCANRAWDNAVACSPLLTLLSALLGLSWRGSGDLPGEVTSGFNGRKGVDLQQGACVWELPPLGIALMSLPLVVVPSNVTNIRSPWLPEVVPPITLHGPPTYCAPVLEPRDAPARTPSLFDPPPHELCHRSAPVTHI